jgi:hypothetical protein
VWASLVPVKKPGSVCRVRVTQNTTQVSAINLECCPPSAWNGVHHHAGTLSAISVESCPPWRGIRTKRIDEKKSSNSHGKEGNKWLHPDMVGLEELASGWSYEMKNLSAKSGARQCDGCGRPLHDEHFFAEVCLPTHAGAWGYAS